MNNIPDSFFRVSAKWVVFNDEWKLLLIRWGSKWWLPGGWIDHGENIRDALIREIYEEMLLNVKYISEAPIFAIPSHDKKRWYHRMNLNYSLELEHFEFTPTNECNEIRFFELSEVTEELARPDVVELVKYIVSNKK